MLYDRRTRRTKRGLDTGRASDTPWLSGNVIYLPVNPRGFLPAHAEAPTRDRQAATGNQVREQLLAVLDGL
jgi:hypothetical protein